MTIIKFKKLDDNAIEPQRGSEDAACLDLFALEDTVFWPGEVKLVRTGWACEVPEGYRTNIYVRSSTPIKKGFMLANSVGIIDNDYRGELFVQLLNIKNQPIIVPGGTELEWLSNKVEAGDKIAQIELIPYLVPHFEIVNKLSDTQRGGGGFGSTGL